jgi:hypothetical protein
MEPLPQETPLQLLQAKEIMVEFLMRTKQRVALVEVEHLLSVLMVAPILLHLVVLVVLAPRPQLLVLL